MLARGLVVVGLAGALACRPLPDVTIEADDAASTSREDAGPPPDAASNGTFDATGDGAAADATILDGSEVADALGSVDANNDDAPVSELDSSTCIPSGAPPGTSCCPNGNPCIGPACSHCNECNCALGLYCCATENGGGKFQTTNCSSAPTGPQCPMQ